jgi:hypothetical protein
MERRIEPSGVPSSPSCVQVAHMRCSFQPETGTQVCPPSPERNSAGGDVPAYQSSGSLSAPGCSQNTWSTTRPSSPFGTFGKAGGPDTSLHVFPRSIER